ncbi:hypothetical protein [Janthinobacterium psychrotolerans]|uniref:Uncharacterized protein n=1 Tax=Janthinobacterium psychrotolerans TaxID=1747903 RepID=A0A1A7BW13_9BURK|nr:hypothetical protein [Janthinobacterium psychrotolerans]OBV37702.1 hypothetical protein ASR47_1003366 [Janthinobacterium psychrotolerans]
MMRAFTVTVCQATQPLITYPALGTDSAAVIMAAIDRFGPCVITAKPR